MKNRRLLFWGILVLVVGIVFWIPVPVGNRIFHYPGTLESAPLAIAILSNYGPGTGESTSLFALYICSPCFIVTGIILWVTYLIRNPQQNREKSELTKIE